MRITDQDIYRFLLGDIVVGNMYNSPLPLEYRPKDDTPSFAVYERNDKLLWIDHGLTDQYGNKAVNLFQYMRKLPINIQGYHEALRRINTEVKFGMMGQPPTQLRSKPKHDEAPYIRTGQLRDYELAYWNRFQITAEELAYEDVYALYGMGWNENNEPVIKSTPDDPAFIYWWNNNPASFKIYRPLTPNKRDKFRQYNIDGIIEGWNTLTKEFDARNGNLFDIIFVLSSTKDRLVVKKAFGPTCSAINPRGEKDRMDIINKADQLRSMGKRVVCLYDADDPGFTGAKTLADLTGFESYDTRNNLYGWKDFADMKDNTKGGIPYPEIKLIISQLINY